MFLLKPIFFRGGVAEAKKSDLDDTISKLSNKIDRAAARSASLKEEVVELEAELRALAKSQSEI